MIKDLSFEIAVIGGSLGGCLAAYSAAKSGKKVLLTEESDWIGGQLTSQAVPPDEHRWIEQFGCTKTYRKFRNDVRDYYRSHYPLTNDAMKNDKLDPGNSSVSRIAHEPKVSLQLLTTLLAPYVSNGSLTVMTSFRAVRAEVSDDEIQSVELQNTETKQLVRINAKYFLDGTDVGELLRVTGTEYVTGAESKEETGEPSALDRTEPLDMQPVTHVAAIDYIEGEDHTIQKPASYEYWKGFIPSYSPHSILSWYGPDSSTGKEKKFGMFDKDNDGLFALWSYRRIIDPTNFEKGFFKGDVTLLNWPQNDYFLGPIYEVTDEEAERHKKGAKELTLSFLYWLQTEAPRPDGGKGYPGIRLRPDVTGTEDGLAKAPYIRESRRIKSQFRVDETHISANCRDEAPKFFDTVGVGCYHIDLHITTVTNTFYYDNSYPFEIPLGAFIPVRMKNLIPACKNIGTTHLTNGCFRLHPVEWNIGEVAGYLAAMSIDTGKRPAEIRNDPELLQSFQNHLTQQGIEIHWPHITSI
ncbi:FAD-dependent oxidoreductase [Metabacillus indicus]|uniref:FAD-dependent oxidoreductase n=1 Tax=Metabacillus indicus TaxID=246786 RepID=UPI003CF52739